MISNACRAGDAGRPGPPAAVGIEESRQAGVRACRHGSLDQPQQRAATPIAMRSLNTSTPKSLRLRLLIEIGFSRQVNRKADKGSRRPRSSRFEPSASQRCRIARQSIMQSLLARKAAPRNRPKASQKVAWPFTANPNSLIVVVVLKTARPLIETTRVDRHDPREVVLAAASGSARGLSAQQRPVIAFQPQTNRHPPSFTRRFLCVTAWF